MQMHMVELAEQQEEGAQRALAQLAQQVGLSLGLGWAGAGRGMPEDLLGGWRWRWGWGCGVSRGVREASFGGHLGSM